MIDPDLLNFGHRREQTLRPGSDYPVARPVRREPVESDYPEL